MKISHSGGWMIAGIGGFGGNPQIVCAQMAGLNITMQQQPIQVNNLGSPHAVYVAGRQDTRLDASLTDVRHITAATYAECLRLLAAQWNPDETGKVACPTGDGLAVRRRSGF